MADAGVEQSDVGCQFGGSSDRTAEIAAHLLLVNYNRSGQVLDFVHIGTGQLRKSCAGERAEGLDQLALGLGVDGVKQHRGLAAAADATEHHDAVFGDFQIDIAQIVRVRSFDDDVIVHEEFRIGCKYRQ